MIHEDEQRVSIELAVSLARARSSSEVEAAIRAALVTVCPQGTCWLSTTDAQGSQHPHAGVLRLALSDQGRQLGYIAWSAPGVARSFLEQVGALAAATLSDIERVDRMLAQRDQLTELGTSLAGLLLQDEVFHCVGRHVADVFDATRVSVSISSPRASRFITTVLTGTHAGMSGPVPRALTSSLVACMESFEPVYKPYRPAEGDDPDSRMLSSDQILSTLVVPLWIDGLCVGTLNLGSQAPDPWDHAQQQLITQVAGMLGEALRSCRAHEVVHQARRDAEAAIVAKSRFLSALSHELRTPMHGVLGMTSLLRKTVLSDNQAEHVGVIQTSAEAMVSMVQDLLDFSNYEQGNLVLDARTVSPAREIHETFELFRRSAETKGLSFDASCRDLPTAVDLDPGRLRQSLANLISNAIKFTDKGSVQVVASWDLDTLAIEVRDTGPGIPADIDADLFAPFFQLDSTDTRQHGGVGIGLTVCRMLVEAMGGTIGYQSVPGEGSTFHLRLHAPRAATPTPRALAREGLRVLVAEDNRINQLVARRLLEHLGHTAHAVDDGAQAVEAARGESYDLVLMDLQMPVMDGFEATATLIAELGATCPPIVALTANDTVEARDRARHCGITRFLTKPLALQQLVDVLDELASDMV